MGQHVYGGPGFSTLFRMDGYANGHRIVAHLKDDSNFISGMPNAQNGLTLGANGRFYGLAYGGGVESWGVLFEYDPVTNNSFDPAAVGPGDYKLLYSFTDVNGCSGKDSVMIHVHICQGVEENAISRYRVFPNPTSGDCRVSGLSKGTVLVVTNLVGEVIYRKRSVSGSETISLENEAAGVYFLQVVSREKTETIRIIKQ